MRRRSGQRTSWICLRTSLTTTSARRIARTILDAMLVSFLGLLGGLFFDKMFGNVVTIIYLDDCGTKLEFVSLTVIPHLVKIDKVELFQGFQYHFKFLNKSLYSDICHNRSF